MDAKRQIARKYNQTAEEIESYIGKIKEVASNIQHPNDLEYLLQLVNEAKALNDKLKGLDTALDLIKMCEEESEEN